MDFKLVQLNILRSGVMITDCQKKFDMQRRIEGPLKHL